MLSAFVLQAALAAETLAGVSQAGANPAAYDAPRASIGHDSDSHWRR